MKKKKLVIEDDVEIVDPKIYEKALQAVEPAKVGRCSICSGESAPNSTEGLCWVCRRLKISAWRESDQPVNAQE